MVESSSQDFKKKEKKLQNQIKELQKEQEILIDSENQYKEILNSLPHTIFETDLNGILTYANEHAFKLFGYSKKDFSRGLNTIDMIDIDDRKRAAENMKKVFSGHVLGFNEYTAVKKDGSKFPVMLYSQIMLKEDSPAGLRGFLIDISDRKKAEKINLALYNISRAVHSASDLNELFNLLHSSLSSIINTKNFFIALLDKDKDAISFPYSVDEIGDDYSAIIDINDPISLTAEVVRTGKTIEKLGYLGLRE